MKKIDIKNPEAKLIVLGTVSDPTKAEIIKNVLADHQIACEIAGEHQAGFTGTLDIEIIIRESDVDLATQIAKDHNLF